MIVITRSACESRKLNTLARTNAQQLEKLSLNFGIKLDNFDCSCNILIARVDLQIELRFMIRLITFYGTQRSILTIIFARS